jgi:hypothetical protein
MNKKLIYTCTKVRETPMINRKYIYSICNKSIVISELMKPFACLSDDNMCDEQCGACKFVECGLKSL